MNLIVAVDENWAIGYNNELLVSIADDMKFFRKTTTGKVVIMGRKTLEALPNQSALVGRKNIVLTRNKDYEAKDVCLCHSVEDVLEKVKNVDSKDVYVIGGGQIYKEFLPYCDTAHITKVDYSYEADTYISDFDKLKDWRITGQSDEHTYFDICYEFVRYERKGKADEMPE